MYLNGLSIVGLYNMKIEAVHASSWSQEDAGLLVKMSAHVYQNLQQQGRKTSDEGKLICNSHMIRKVMQKKINSENK